MLFHAMSYFRELKYYHKFIYIPTHVAQNLIGFNNWYKVQGVPDKQKAEKEKGEKNKNLNTQVDSIWTKLFQ